MQILTTMHVVSQIIASGRITADDPPKQWKHLLVQAGTGEQYVEIYMLQNVDGLFDTMKSAAIYGTGSEAILGTYDPDSGNGGGCEEGYWWFNKAGSHEVDFSPLL